MALGENQAPCFFSEGSRRGQGQKSTQSIPWGWVGGGPRTGQLVLVPRAQRGGWGSGQVSGVNSGSSPRSSQDA